MPIRVPRYASYRPASDAASRAKSRNRAKDTQAEKVLRRALWRLGLRYRLHQDALPGRPDLVFPTERVAVFCDGDFWHGRQWERRRERLREGANASYWVAKIGRNVERDWEQTHALMEGGWTVLRLWETEVLKDPEGAAAQVRAVVLERRALSEKLR